MRVGELGLAISLPVTLSGRAMDLALNFLAA